MTGAEQSIAKIDLSEDGKHASCSGTWTAAGIVALESKLNTLVNSLKQTTTIDAAGIRTFDSAGALLLQDLLDQLKILGSEVSITGLSKPQAALLKLVSNQVDRFRRSPQAPRDYNALAKIGIWSVDKYIQLMSFLNFFGELIVRTVCTITQPKRIQWRSIMVGIEENGSGALPIVALMTFLIGVVLAYQLGLQLRTYGADIFIVDVSGVAMLREFAPLITAVIMAGRTSTSFAALIGTMKVNEEIDVLQTMGLSPVERLVLPRIFALVIALPLLVVWGDIFGVFGSMLMANNLFGITFHAFLERFEASVALKHYVLGIIKAPVFAIIIAAVGTFQGFQVGASAESVGWKTTKAAVQAIFLIIIADAVFSIVYSWLNL